MLTQPFGAPRRRALLAAAMVLFLGGIAAAEPRPLQPEHALAVVLLSLAAAGGIAFWTLTRPRRAYVIALVGAAGVALTLLSPRGPASVVVFGSIIGLASVPSRRLGVAAAAAIGAAYLMAVFLSDRGTSVLNLAFLALALVATHSGMAAVRRIREERARAEQLLLELRASREAQVEAARLAERAHVAREIHDVLAHSLSALAVQLESARLMLEQRPGDPDAVAAVARAHGLARQGIEETRRAVAALRGEAVPGPDLIAQLCRDFEAESGVPCRFDVEGNARPLGGDAGLALYRTAQEALTNVRRHARPSRVEVRLAYEPDGIVLAVEDVGEALVPVGAGADGGGYGLVGMRERAELQGGRLDAGPTASGFRVRLWLPA